MKADEKRFDLYLLAVIAASMAFVVYWAAFTFYKYLAFKEYFWDLGQEAYSMYIHLHDPGLIHGLQFLAFSNHISIFKLLLLPVFAVYQNPMTLVLFQDVALALCAIVAYFIGKNVIKNRLVGLALALAFLLNPGVRGITFFDVHVEAFIPLFFLLAFYFYMRDRKAYFLASYILMLSLIETAPFVGISLLLALLLYELIYASVRTEKELSRRRGRLVIIVAAFLISLVFIAFYFYVASSLVSAYQSGAYSAMPPFLKIVNFLSIQVRALGNTGGVAYNPNAIAYLMVWGLLILVLGFGLTGFRNIILTLILVAPWAVEVLVLHNTIFAVLYYHYYAYVVGGAVAAAALGFMIIARKKPRPFGIGTEKLVRILAYLTVLMAVVVSAVMLVGLPNLLGFLPTSWRPIQNYSAIENALASIPLNSSVMTQPSIAAHLYDVLYIELPPNETVGGFSPVGFVNNFNITTFYTVPEYIVLDRQLPDYALFNSTKFNVYGYMGQNYTLCSSSGGLDVYRSIRLTGSATS